MSLHDVRWLFAADKNMARSFSRSCIEEHCAVSHKEHRSARRRIKQLLLKRGHLSEEGSVC